MKYLAASLALAAFLAGCAYEPGEWYGIHAAVPERQITKYTDSASQPAQPVASAGHARTAR